MKIQSVSKIKIPQTAPKREPVFKGQKVKGQEGVKKMKKALFWTLLAIMACIPVMATEQPLQSVNDNRVVAAIQKQPSKANKQEAKRNWFCIVIQINGKVKDYNNSADK